jgi:hypothetical protein
MIPPILITSNSIWMDLLKLAFSDLNISNQIQRPLLMDKKRNSFAGSTTTEGLHKRDKEIEDLIFPPPDHSNLKLKGISTNSQVSSTFYSTKTYPLTHKDDEGDSTSPSASDFNGPLPPFHQCSVIHTVSKGFFSHKLIGQRCKKIFLQKRIEIYGILTVPDFQKEKETSLKSNGQEK